MEPDDPLLALTTHPTELSAFVRGIEEAGFARTGEREWIGPISPALIPLVDTDQMRIIIRPGWPYFPPGVGVEGIGSWHANRDAVCLWQTGDNTRRWVSLTDIHARINDWVADQATGFERHGLALDPHLYFDAAMFGHAFLNPSEILGARPTDGQTGTLKWSEIGQGVFDIDIGKFKASDVLPHGLTDRVNARGRWFYRDQHLEPPRDLDAFRPVLTENQASRFDADVRAAHLKVLLLVLFWRVGNDVAALVLLVSDPAGSRTTYVFAPEPKGLESRILRAGPDASALRDKSVLIIGCGAIGSNIAELLARSGIGLLNLVDNDRLWPANLIRHAVLEPGKHGAAKTEALKTQLSVFDWVNIETHDERLVEPDRIQELIEDVDLVLDAAGDAALTDLVAHIALETGKPLVSVALFRGGTIARIRRQADGDSPIASRRGQPRYPEIRPAPDQVEYLGLETGCAAPINNAPPISVARSAAIAAQVCVDWLNSRKAYEDETIEAFFPSDPPFDTIGTIRREQLLVPIAVSEAAQAEMRRAASDAAPNETGGVLVGTHVDGRTHVALAVEIAPAEPSRAGFTIPEGDAKAVIESLAAEDPRLGYLGEWHSHPADQGPSATDRATMQALSLNADTGSPLLIVLRPSDSGVFTLDPYRTNCGLLEPVDTVTTGDLPEEATP